MSRRQKLLDDVKNFPKDAARASLGAIEVEFDADDGTLSFTPEGAFPITATPPDNYPRGQFSLWMNDDLVQVTLTGERPPLVEVADYCLKQTLLHSGDSFSGGLRDSAESFGRAEHALDVMFAADLELFRSLFPHIMVQIETEEVLETHSVTLTTSLHSVLDRMTIEAWGAIPDLDVHVRLNFSFAYMGQATPPTVEVFQRVTNEDGSTEHLSMGMVHQLSMIIDRFLNEMWPERAHIQRRHVDSSSSMMICEVEEREDTYLTPELLSLTEGLVSMFPFFPLTTVVNAFLHAGKNADEAAVLLVEDPEKCAHPPKQQIKRTARIERYEKDNALEMSFGFLVMVMTYFLRRTSTLHHYCVICDETHLFGHGSMLKPAVCTRELCCFSFQQYGVGSGSTKEIATATGVVDLLLSMLQVAARSPRADVILKPFPMIFHHERQDTLILDPDAPDFPKLRGILDSFPSMEQLCGGTAGHMKETLDASHPYAFALLSWVISSSRCHIVKLQGEQMLPELATKHQFLLASASPEKEQRFQELKAEHGSIFAFHGSPIANWHSIMRTGLRNASGSKLQLHGAAYGNGIYLAANSSTSFSYCRGQGGAATSTESQFIRDADKCICLALCEVVNKPAAFKNSGGIYVVPDEDLVNTRFFFVYEQNRSVSVNASDSAFVKRVTDAMNVYQTL